MKNNELIHSTIITLDIPAFKNSKVGNEKESPREQVSIEDSLNTVLAGLTQTLISSPPCERPSIQRRIDDIVAILERRNW